MKVYILSGAPGSGKSTIAQKLIDTEKDGVVVCSADSFFYDFDGKYKFDPAKLGAAHAACLLKYAECLHNCRFADRGHLVVDNTNVDATEIAPYYALAAAYGCDVSIYTTLCEADIAFKRNVHNVPERVIQSMCDRLKNRKLPHYWKEERVWPLGNSCLHTGPHE